MPMSAFAGIYAGLVESSTLFVAETGGMVIATYRLIPKTDRQAHTVYLGSFAIRKDQQGKGFGKQVLIHIKTYALEQQKSRIELTVDVNNTHAIELYKKAGFLIEGVVRNSYRRSDTKAFYDEYLMGLLL
jgi:putative acetyltransferase